MKLATTTADFSAYAKTPAASLELCGKSPFRYIDLNLPHRFMTEDWERITHDVGETAARLGMTTVLVGAHAAASTSEHVHHRTHDLAAFLDAARLQGSPP